jgi:hypothetical protein
MSLVLSPNVHAVYLIGVLPNLDWFEHDPDELTMYSVAVVKDAMNGAEWGTPKGWCKPARKQLPPAELKQRTTITWAIPRADLEPAIANKEDVGWRSHAVYAAGTGLRLFLDLEFNKDDNLMHLSAYLENCAYQLPGTEHKAVCPAAQFSEYHIRRQLIGGRSTIESHGERTTYTGCWGCEFLELSSISDLDQHLVDGCLKLEATFTVLH